jgi:hypothetical protein
VAALAVFLAYNTTTARFLWITPDVERRIDGPQLVGTENATFGAGTTTGGEFVPRVADLEALGAGKRRGNGVYEQLYPEFGWIGGRVRPIEGRMRVADLAAGPYWTEARVIADEPGALGFRTIAFPGWRAYVDGREVQPRLAPRDAALEVSPGFIVVPVPAGEHRVQIAFGPTRLRSATAAASIVALGWLAWWLTAPYRRRTTGARSSAITAAALAPVVLLAGAWVHDVVRPALGPPAAPAPRDRRLIADVAELARGGGAQISSPSGQSLGPFVDVRRLAVNGHERRWLYMHPPASVAVTLVLPERAAFQAGLALDPGSWHADGADGVTFSLDVRPEGDASVRVFEEHVNPRARGEDRAWLDRWIDLSAFGGKRVTLTLRTDSVRTPDYDWAGWAAPVIIVQGEARRPGGGPPGPLPTPRAN